jgi:hypothetical protein
MDLFLVMTQVGAALDTITGLNVKAWSPERVTPPAALVALPAGLNYHGAYGTGLQEIKDLTVVVLVGKASDRVAFKRICEYVKASGPRSVKTAVEGYAYTALDTITVTGVTFSPAEEKDGTEYLAAVFHIDITGPAT